MQKKVVTASVTAVDNGTEALAADYATGRHHLALEISGTFVATIQLQKSSDGGVTWVLAAGGSFTTPIATAALIQETALYRLQVTEFTSGTVELRLLRN